MNLGSCIGGDDVTGVKGGDSNQRRYFANLLPF